ncbi:hypothetical protein Cadr_000007880 [Camelus dromedarius]|uniref:Uncharacterized protein n=1 Tax=Camelus dromedarius TaxID=9838 RepID=A0A5N4DZM5_CAMDR|nr:hypothetical protein Cadr_000007880 [Camelus dromedarius]
MRGLDDETFSAKSRRDVGKSSEDRIRNWSCGTQTRECQPHPEAGRGVERFWCPVSAFPSFNQICCHGTILQHLVHPAGPVPQIKENFR